MQVECVTYEWVEVGNSFKLCGVFVFVCVVSVKYFTAQHQPY